MAWSEGGDGFIIRHLVDGWGKVPSRFESLNDVEDLQDQMIKEDLPQELIA